MEKLNPSKLGTKQYWDDFYSVEKSNFQVNPNDTGECWFSDSGAEEKMVDFLEDLVEQHKIEGLSFESTIVDLGTGNGHLLFSLSEAGFNGQLAGLDYSLQSVELAKMIGVDLGLENIEFEHADFLGDSVWRAQHAKAWDIVVDKGTLDAIALSDTVYKDGDSREISGVELYPSAVWSLINPKGIFIITSCNFTQQELIDIITAGGHFEVYDSVKYGTFQFGGVQGQTICTVAFTPMLQQ